MQRKVFAPKRRGYAQIGQPVLQLPFVSASIVLGVVVTLIAAAGLTLGIISVVQNSNQSTQIETLQEDLLAAEANITQLDMMLEMAKTNITQLDMMLEMAKIDITQLQNETSTLESELAKTKIDLMMTEVKVLQLEAMSNASETAFSYSLSGGTVTSLELIPINGILSDTQGWYDEATDPNRFPVLNSGVYTFGYTCIVTALGVGEVVKFIPSLASDPPCSSGNGLVAIEGLIAPNGVATYTSYGAISVNATSPVVIDMCTNKSNMSCFVSGVRISDLSGDADIVFPFSP